VWTAVGGLGATRGPGKLPYSFLNPRSGFTHDGVAPGGPAPPPGARASPGVPLPAVAGGTRAGVP